MISGKAESLSSEYAIRAWSRRYSGAWTEADEADLQRWLLAAQEHRIAYDHLAALWASSGRLDGRVKRITPMTRTTGRRRMMVACVAALVTAVVLPLWNYTYHWWNGELVRWVTASGEHRTIELRDGTRIVLDAGSELVVRLGAHARRAALVRGEGLFSVKHDPSVPFELEIGPGRVTDLGTRFDVEILHGATRIAVLEGRVALATRHGEELLTAGHSGGYDSSGTLLPVHAVDESITQWTSGLRYFDNEPLRAVVERLERYHGVTFVFRDRQLEQLQLSGTFHVTDLPLFLQTLSTALPVQARWIDVGRIELADRANTPGEIPPQGITSGERPP